MIEKNSGFDSKEGGRTDSDVMIVSFLVSLTLQRQLNG
jgi:hypothetical protein